MTRPNPDQGTFYEGWDESEITPEAREMVRASHPDTSFEAAEKLVSSGKLAQRQKHALDCVRKWPGRTARELDFQNHSTERQVGKCLSKLRERGLIKNGDTRKCTVTGNRAQTWYPVSK